MTQSDIRNYKIGNAGLGIVEVLIAVFILGVVSMVVSSTIRNQSKTSSSLMRASSCQEIANTVISNINSLGTRDSIFTPSSYLSLELSAPTSSDVAVLNSLVPLNSSRAAMILPTWFNATTSQIITNDMNVPSRPIFLNSEFIMNGVNLLQTLYNVTGTSICTADRGVDFKTQFLAVNGLTELPRQIRSIFLKVEPFNINSNSFAGCLTPPVYSAPARGLKPGAAGIGTPTNDVAIDGFTIKGDSYLGYRATASIEVLDQSSGAIGSCNAQQVFSHQADFTKPVPPTIQGITNGLGQDLLGNAGQLLTSCNGGVATGPYQDINLTWNIANLENGSLVLCQTTTSDGSAGAVMSTPKMPCKDIYYQVGGNRYYLSQPPITAAGTMVLKFSGLPPDFQYNMGVFVVDTAGNYSTTNGAATFRIDFTRPTVMGLVPTGPPGDVNVGVPGDGLRGRGVFPGPFTSRNLASRFALPNGTVQCNNRSANFKVMYSGSLAANRVTCTATSDLPGATTCFDPNDGTCLVAIPGPIPAGNHQVQVTAYDVCGQGSTFTYRWPTILNMVVDGFNPTTFDNTTNAGDYSMQFAYTGQPDPQHFMAICDKSALSIDNVFDGRACNVDTSVPGFAAPVQACNVNAGVQGPGTQNNMQGFVFDVCGRTSTNPAKLTSYWEVMGRAGERCGSQRCGVGQLCAQNNGGSASPGICTPETSDPTSSCATGHTPLTLPADCPGIDVNLWNCNTSGTCSGAGIPPWATCIGINGSPCTHWNGTTTLNGTCSISPVACSTVGRGPFNTGSNLNSACPTRTSGAYTGVVPTPPAFIPNCTGELPSLQNMQTRCATSYNADGTPTVWQTWGTSYSPSDSNVGGICQVQFSTENVGTVTFDQTSLNNTSTTVNQNTCTTATANECVQVTTTGDGRANVVLQFSAGPTNNYHGTKTVSLDAQPGCGPMGSSPNTKNTTTSHCSAGTCTLGVPAIPGQCTGP